MSEMAETWTAEDLADLRTRAKAMGPDFSLQGLAVAVGRGSRDVNLALHALLGKTPEEAAAALEAEGARVRDWIRIQRGRFERAIEQLLG